jgi:hypothetical protein
MSNRASLACGEGTVKPNPKNPYMGRPCARGHSGERYRADGRCCECANLRQALRYRKFQKKRGPTKPERAGLAREKARRAGRTFYRGQKCKYGHEGKRFVNTAMCAHPDCVRRYRHPPLHELPRKEHERILREHRERGRRASKALAVLRELGLRL